MGKTKKLRKLIKAVKMGNHVLCTDLVFALKQEI